MRFSMVHFYVLHTTDHLGMRNNILRLASKSRIALLPRDWSISTRVSKLY